MFKSIFICDKCGQEGPPENKYAEWECIYDYIVDETRSGKQEKIDLCRACHDKVFQYVKAKT